MTLKFGILTDKAVVVCSNVTQLLRVSRLITLSPVSAGNGSGGGWGGGCPLHPVRDVGRQDGERQNRGQQPGLRRLGGQTEDRLSDSSAQTAVEEIPTPVRLSRLAAPQLSAALHLRLTACLCTALHSAVITRRTCTSSPPWL